MAGAAPPVSWRANLVHYSVLTMVVRGASTADSVSLARQAQCPIHGCPTSANKQPNLACDSDFWGYYEVAADSTNHSLNVDEFFQLWAAGCEACAKAIFNPQWLFLCASKGLVGKEHNRHRLGLLMLRRAVDLATELAWKEPRFLKEELPCRQPLSDKDRFKKFNEELLSIELASGRVCENGHCAEQCNLIVFEKAFASWEVGALIKHGTAIRTQHSLDDIGAISSMEYGHRNLHLLFMYTLERLRRLVARSAGVNVSSTKIASSFLSYRSAGSVNHVHCDEGSFSKFHHSGVLWLTAHDHKSGGELEFWDTDQRQWRRKVAPKPGRVALFTSGWENVHHVTNLTQGHRWSLPIFVSLKATPERVEPLNATVIAVACFGSPNPLRFPKNSTQLLQYWRGWQETCSNELSKWFASPGVDAL